MIRVPRVCLVFVVIALLALLMAPVAGARTVSSPSVHPAADGGWVGAALRWVEDLAGLHRQAPGHRGTKPVSTKETSTTDGVTGTCIDPMGRPRPCF